jgi:hypothetical protein
VAVTDVDEQFNPSFLEEVQRAYPQYFNDLAPLRRRPLTRVDGSSQ